jgi:beta-glucosidase/6-phospho-beta-glucosidase/beta-galactosidase
MAPLFHSFIQGGFECSTLRLPDGRRRDLLDSTGHARHAAADFHALAGLGIHTVRDGARWHLIEQEDGRFDWSSFLPQIDAAARCGTQVIWDLCHYGWPDHIDIWSPRFVENFARFAGRAAALICERGGRPGLYCPINEISFWAWGGGDIGCIGPCALDRGDALKRQLVRASLAAMDAIRVADPHARFVLADPMIRVAPLTPDAQEAAAAANKAQYRAWDMIAGKACAELGGAEHYLDVLGVNFYPHNQWFLDGPTIRRPDSAYMPVRTLLARVHERYGRPIVIAETGAEGDHRAEWLRYMCDEVAAAMSAGVRIEGVCLYPVTDYPGWDDDRHCPTGVLGYPDCDGKRAIHLPTAAELLAQRRRFDRLRADLADGRLAVRS